MDKKDLPLNNLQWLICHKTKRITPTKSFRLFSFQRVHYSLFLE